MLLWCLQCYVCTYVFLVICGVIFTINLFSISDSSAACLTVHALFKIVTTYIDYLCWSVEYGETIYEKLLINLLDKAENLQIKYFFKDTGKEFKNYNFE